MSVKTVELYIEYLQRRVDKLDKSLEEDKKDRKLMEEKGECSEQSVSNFSRFTEAVTLKKVIRDLNELVPKAYIPSYWGLE